MDGSPAVEVAVLGPTVLDGAEAPSRLQARLLAGLVAVGRDGAAVGRLEDLVWPDGAPATGRASLQNLVARLRRRLGEEAVVWTGARYRLGPEVRTDVSELLRLLTALDAARERGDPAVVVATAEQARALFRGTPFADLGVDVARTQRRRLEEMRELLDETRAAALGELGRIDEAVVAWRTLVDARPHHEGRWAQLLTALHAAGRRAEALEAYQEARQRLLDDLGLEPGTVLTTAHRAVIDDRLDPLSTPVEDPVPRPAVAAQVRVALAATGWVVLTGEPGIGKTTVAEGVTDERPGSVVLRVQCQENPWTALQPLEDLLRTIATPVRDLDPPPGPATQRLIGGTGEAGDGPPLGLVADVSDTLVRAFAGHPATLVLDDAGHAGPTTWRVLDQVRQRVPGLRVLAATRDLADLPASTAGDADEIRLPGLDLPELTELVGRLLRRRGQVGPLARWTHEATGGNPLFTIELIAELRRIEAIRMGPDGAAAPGDLPLPDQLRQVIGRRLGELGVRTTRSLEALAVLGDRADHATVGRLGADPGALATAVDAGVIVADGSCWRFPHALLRRTVLELLAPGRRLELELVAAAVLTEQGATASVVATHRLAAADVDPVGAARAALEAAEDAVREQAFEEAIAWTERGRDAIDRSSADAPHTRVALAVVGADARRLAGAPDHADDLLAACEQALQLDDPELRRQAVLATLRLGACCQPGSEQERAVRLADRALELEDDPGGRAMLHASASLTHSMVDADACRDHFRLALDELAGAGVDDPAVLVEVLPYAYLGLGLPDDLARRAHAAERLAGTADAVDDPAAAFEARHLRFSVALQGGDRAAMLAAHAEMTDLAPRVADAGRRWALAYQRATLLQLDGDLDAADAAAEETLAIGTTVAAARAFATWTAQTLELRRLQGRLHELAPVLEAFVADPAALPAWRTAAALVFAPERPEDARRLVGELVADLDALPTDFARGAALLTLARAIVALGAGEHARPVLDCLRPWAHLLSWQGTTTYGPYGQLVAELGELVDDEDAVRAGRAGAAAVTRRLASPVYAPPA